MFLPPANQLIVEREKEEMSRDGAVSVSVQVQRLEVQ